MKKIISICVGFILFLWIVMFMASCTPVRYVYIDPQDSIVKKQRIIYDYQYTPLYYNIRPYYNPFIIQRWNTPRYYPQHWVPQRPSYRYTTPIQPLQRPNTHWRVPRKS